MLQIETVASIFCVNVGETGNEVRAKGEKGRRQKRKRNSRKRRRRWWWKRGWGRLEGGGWAGDTVR